MQLMIPAESARDTIAAIGEVGMLQFKDLNTDKSAFQRTYANQVKRCDEMARKLRFFTDEVGVLRGRAATCCSAVAPVGERHFFARSRIF